MKFLHRVILLALIASASFADVHRTCGTTRLLNHLRGHSTQIKKNEPLARATSTACTDNDLYDSVYTRTTPHFEIFYTLMGPHQTTIAFVDTLAGALEYAWDFHVQKNGMRPPLGETTTFQYQKKVTSGLYPVEVIDIDLLRNTGYLIGGACHGCFGITIPASSGEASLLLIDNDFRYTPEYNPLKDTLSVNGKNCSYNIASEELRNSAYGYSYADRWEEGIRVTTAHELYHAIQFRYLDMNRYWTFWFEASASGVEEIVRPDINDYISYLSSMSNLVGTPLDSMYEDYGAGILFIYLYNHVNKKADRYIWESFSQRPAKPFHYHLDDFAQKNGLSADSLFHDFTVRLSVAGKNSSLTDSSFWINGDQSRWPEFRHTPTSQLYRSPHLQPLSYQFYAGGKPDLSDYNGKASVATVTGNQYSIQYLASINSVDSAYIAIQNNPNIDSVLWILSRFDTEEKLPHLVTDSTLRAFPTPWRNGTLCFTPLPYDKEFIEIRNRRGNLVSKEKYSGNTLCIEEVRVKKLMAPGVYRFRVGNSGKTRNFIIVY